METNNEVLKFLRSRTFLVAIVGLLAVAVLSGVFSVGMAVGYRKARFSYAWGENYHRNFAGPRGGFFGDPNGRQFIEAHGSYGQIIGISGSEVVVKGKDGVERIILTSDQTLVERFWEKLKAVDLKINDQIVVIGEPNGAGQIQAKLIRVMLPR